MAKKDQAKSPPSNSLRPCPLKAAASRTDGPPRPQAALVAVLAIWPQASSAAPSPARPIGLFVIVFAIAVGLVATETRRQIPTRPSRFRHHQHGSRGRPCRLQPSPPTLPEHQPGQSNTELKRLATVGRSRPRCQRHRQASHGSTRTRRLPNGRDPTLKTSMTVPASNYKQQR